MVQYQCPRCGQLFNLPQPVNMAHCPYCGQEFQPVAPSAVPPQNPQPQYGYGPMPQEPGVFDSGPSGKSRGVAGLLAILLGGFGAHYFYLGKIGGGFICLLLCLVTCGLWSILTLVQGIVMMTMKQNDFEQKFVYSQSTFPLF